MRFTAATYNIHRCVGRNGDYSPSRTRDVLSEMDADIVAVQEFDNRARYGRPELEPEHLSEPLGMTCVSQPTLEDPRGGYQANLLLSRHPVGDIRHVDLGRSGPEVRRAILARVEMPEGALVAVSTHLGLTVISRRRQARTLVEAVVNYADGLPVVLLGDFNEWLHVGGCHSILARRFDGGERRPTFPVRAPLLPLDRAWVGGGLEIEDLQVHHTETSAIASDHLPLVASVSASSSADRTASSTNRPGSDETSTISP